jgi:hypothetical protein
MPTTQSSKPLATEIVIGGSGDDELIGSSLANRRHKAQFDRPATGR